MTKQVLDVGSCAPDHAALRRLIESSFDAAVVQAHGPEDALAELRRRSFALVLVNRKLDRDDRDGVEVIRQIKSDPELMPVPVMLITNYAEYQDLAVAAGAVRGFGKAEIGEERTLAELNRYLGRPIKQ
jgi:CheY-like chemotaxis protein